eukprot:6194264-Pleurochrysis_carterae.AAC.1
MARHAVRAPHTRKQSAIFSFQSSQVVNNKSKQAIFTAEPRPSLHALHALPSALSGAPPLRRRPRSASPRAVSFAAAALPGSRASTRRGSAPRARAGTRAGCARDGKARGQSQVNRRMRVNRRVPHTGQKASALRLQGNSVLRPGCSERAQEGWE